MWGKVSLFIVFLPAQVGLCALEVIKVLRFIVFPRAQVGLCALEVTRVSILIVFLPLLGWGIALSKLPKLFFFSVWSSRCQLICLGSTPV